MALPDVEGKVAVVTGASRGIGAALASDFARRGLALGLCARGEPALAESARVLARRVDVRDESAIDRFAADVVARFGRIDLWINNAGVLEPIAPVRDVEAAAFRAHLDTNVVGVFLGTRAFVRHLRARGGEGVLINVSSGAAWSAYAGWGAYCAGKAAVERFTEVVSLEESAHGLRAYSVAPGVVDTHMQELIRASSPDDFPLVDRFLEMKRDEAFNTPEFVAQQMLAIAFDPEARPEAVAHRIPFG